MNVIETRGLSRRYGSTLALRDVTVAVPAGHVAALVGPNGAGKTTLLNLVVGLAAPTAGTVSVLGGEPAGSPAALDDIAFVAQDAPLYKNLPVTDMLRLTGVVRAGPARTRRRRPPPQPPAGMGGGRLRPAHPAARRPILSK